MYFHLHNCYSVFSSGDMIATQGGFNLWGRMLQFNLSMPDTSQGRTHRAIDQSFWIPLGHLHIFSFRGPILFRMHKASGDCG
jgi:hypothetical protein